MKRRIICKDCLKPGLHNGRGLCSPCYKKEWRLRNKEKAAKHNKSWREKFPGRSRDYYSKHKDELSRNSKKWREANKDKIKNKYLKYQYGITKEDYDALLKHQNFSCKICGASPINFPVVEHNHKTGIVRGIVCQKCNITIASIENNKHLLKTILEYLEAHDQLTENPIV